MLNLLVSLTKLSIKEVIYLFPVLRLEGLRTHELKICGEYFPVKARIKELHSLSAHADQSELIRWLKEFKTIKPNVFLVHGEPSAQQALLVKIKDEFDIQATIVKKGEKLLLFSLEKE